MMNVQSPLARRDVNAPDVASPKVHHAAGCFGSLLADACEETKQERLRENAQAKGCDERRVEQRKVKQSKDARFNEMMARGWQDMYKEKFEREEAARIEENTRNDTIGMVAALKLEREFKDEDMAIDMDAEEGHKAELLKLEQKRAESESAAIAPDLQQQLREEAEREAEERDARDASVAKELQLAEAGGMKEAERQLKKQWRNVKVEAGQIEGGVSLVMYLPELISFSTSVTGKGGSSIMVEAKASAPQTAAQVTGVKAPKSKPPALKKRIDVFPVGAYAALQPSDLREDYDSSTGYLRIDVPLRPKGEAKEEEWMGEDPGESEDETKEQADAKCWNESEDECGEEAENLRRLAEMQSHVDEEFAARLQLAEQKGMEISERRLKQQWCDVEVEAGQIDDGVSIMLYLPELISFSTSVTGKGGSSIMVEAKASAPQTAAQVTGVKAPKSKPPALKKRIDVFPVGAYAALQPSDLREDYDSSTGYLRIDVPLRPADGSAKTGRSGLLLKFTRKIFGHGRAEAKE